MNERNFYQLSGIALIFLLIFIGHRLTKAENEVLKLQKVNVIKDTINERNKRTIAAQYAIIDSFTYCPTREAMVKWLKENN